MKIGILGMGHIGKTLVRTLSAAGHDVKVANSRGPNTVDSELLTFGCRAVTAEDAVDDVDVIILSIPLIRIVDIKTLIAGVPAEVVVIDTSNYYPTRDDRIGAIDSGQVESLWVVEQLGRPIAKAWNAIGSDSFAKKGKPPRSLDRLAIPVAADREWDRSVAMALVDDSGLDPVDAGGLAESWRQQPGAPSYCTDLTRDEIVAALASANRASLPKRRDIATAAVHERMGDDGTNPGAEYLVRLNRAVYM